MTEIVQKLDYDENLELLPEEYKRSPNIIGMLQASHASANNLEQAIFEVRDEFWLNSRGQSRTVPEYGDYEAVLDGSGFVDLIQDLNITTSDNFDLEIEAEINNTSSGANILSDEALDNTVYFATEETPDQWNIKRGGQSQGTDFGTDIDGNLHTYRVLGLDTSPTTADYALFVDGDLDSVFSANAVDGSFSRALWGLVGKVRRISLSINSVAQFHLIPGGDRFYDTVGENFLEASNVFFNKIGDGPESFERGGSAIGVQLDVLGDIFTEARLGDTDEDYRNRIIKKAASQYSGTPEDIIAAIKGLYGATMVEYDPGYPGTPGTFNILADIAITEDQLNALAPAGVNGILGNNFALGTGDNFVFGNGDNYTVA